MSPEQTKLNQLDIDTRSDIYSLGVLLYELLTGETPLDRERLRSAAFDEMLRIIREEEPPKPSLRLSSSHTLPSIAANRHIEPKKLSTLVRGELDWIVMKALEKDRTRRYETANGFAADIERYLKDEPVVACPPSTVYRFKKFARRNKAALAVASAATLTLILLAAGSLIAAGNFRALAQHNAKLVVGKQAALTAETEAKNTARQAQRDAEQALVESRQQRRRAEANFNLARSAVDKFLNHVTDNELLTFPGLQPLRQSLLAESLDFYTEFTRERSDDPQLQVELASAQYRLGTIHNELGNGEASRAANQEAIRLLESLREKEIEDIELLTTLADAYFMAGRHDEAIEVCRQVLETHPKTVAARSTLAETYNTLGSGASGDNNIAAALQYHRQAFAIRQELVTEYPGSAEYNAELGATINNIGVILGKQNKVSDQLATFQVAVSHNKRACELAPHSILWGRWLATTYGNIAAVQRKLGDDQEALTACRLQAAIWRRLVTQNPAVSYLRGDYYKAVLLLAHHERRLGLLVEANRSFRDARELLTQMPHETADELLVLATVFGSLAGFATEGHDAGSDDAEAADERRRNADLAMQHLQQAVDAGWADPAALNYTAFKPLQEREDFQELAKVVETAFEARRLLADDASLDAASLAEKQSVVKALEVLTDRQPDVIPPRRALAATHHSIGVIQTELKQFAEAEASFGEALRLRKELLETEPDSPWEEFGVVSARVALGQLYWTTSRFPEAHEIWRECLDESWRLADANREDKALQEQIAADERKICDAYGQCGLWPLAREYPVQRVRLGHVRTGDSDLWITDAAFAILLLLDPNFTELADEGLQLLAESLRGMEDQSPFDSSKLARAAAMLPSTSLPIDDLISFARRIYADQKGRWFGEALAVTLYRGEEPAEAQELLKELGSPSNHLLLRLNTPYIEAMVAWKLGQRDLARDTLAVAEDEYGKVCQQLVAFSAEVSIGRRIGNSTRNNWRAFAYAQALRREALNVIRQGEPVADDAWQHLIQARGYRLIGEIEKADTELAAASAAAPEDVQM